MSDMNNSTYFGAWTSMSYWMGFIAIACLPVTLLILLFLYIFGKILIWYEKKTGKEQLDA